MRYNIYNANGTLKTQTASIEYKGEWMGERSVTVSVKSSVPISFNVGDYLLYRNERFELNVSPTVQKQATAGTYGEAFIYSNIKFDSLTDELVRCFFFDCTLSQNSVTMGTNSKFSFHCSDISDLANRIQANLNRLYTGAKAWTVRVVQGYTPTSDKEANQTLTVDNINCWQALAMAYEQLGVKFIVEKQARTITLGTSGTIHDTLLFGKGSGLKKVTKTSQSNQNIVTKVRAYGNTTNMPQHYYYYKVLHCVCPLSFLASRDGYCIHTPTGVSSTEMLFMIRNNDIWTTDIATYYSHRIKVTRNNEVLYSGKHYLCYDADENVVIITGLRTATNGIISTTATDIKVEIITANKHYIPIPFKQCDIADNATLIPVQNLMLPSFPTQTLDPYIVSDNISELGIREAVVYFDGSNDNEDIFPTLVGVTMKQIEDAGYTAYIATEDTGKAKADIRLDEVLSVSKKPLVPISTAEDYYNNSVITDDGIFDEESSFTDADGHFLLRIRNIGFDLASADIKLSSDEYPVLSMKDGACGGRDFNVVDCKLSNDKTYYTLQCERVKDSSLNQYFPNKDALIQYGDKFVITNINMPDLYIDAASARLETAARLWLADNEATTYTYSVELDNIYLARQHDYAIENDETSIHDTIKEGDVLCIADDDINIDEAIEITNLTIKEGNSPIPEYSVTLSTEKTVSSLQRIQNAIKGITDGTISIPGISVPQIKDIVNTTIKNLKLDEKYLNKTTDDNANGNYGFYGDVTFGNPSDNQKKYVENIKGCKIYWNGSGWCVDTDYLNVQKKATFKSLEIEKVSHIGGQQLLTACGCIVEHVYYNQASGFSVFFAKEDKDGKPVTNDWAVGDLAYCQTFNVNEGASQNVSNRYYWVRVLNVTGSAITELTDYVTGETFDPRNYHRIIFKCENVQGEAPYCDIPNTNTNGTPCVDETKNTSDTPIIGDNIVLMGHVKQQNETQAEARQGATLLAGAGRWGQALVMWRGIGANANNPFTMPDADVIISPQNVKITADEMLLSSRGSLFLRSNQLICQNIENKKTMWLDEFGNVNIAGILNRMSFAIKGDNYSNFFHICEPLDGDDEDDFVYHAQCSDWGTYIGDTGLALYEKTFIPELFKLDGVITLGAYSNDVNENRFNMLFPFYIPVRYDDDNGSLLAVREWYDVCRTITDNGGTSHFINLAELHSLIGRKITFYNTSNAICVAYPRMMKESVQGVAGISEAYTLEGYFRYEISQGRMFTVEIVNDIVRVEEADHTPHFISGVFPLITIAEGTTPLNTDEWGTD